MKLCEVIDEVKRIKKGYEIEDKSIIRWVNAVEHMVFTEIVKGREGEESYADFDGYGIDTDRNTQLKILEPYCSMYEYYCCAMVDSEYDEIDRYQNDMMRFNQCYKDFAIVYAREHRQKNNYNYNYGGI